MLKAETATPPAEGCAAQQRVFDRWRGEYNHERPHEALRMKCPGSVYVSSKHSYPRPLVERFFEPFTETARVDKFGCIKWHQRSVHIGSALRYEYVELEINPNFDGRWDVCWGDIRLGYLDEHRRERGLIYPRRRRGTKESPAVLVARAVGRAAPLPLV